MVFGLLVGLLDVLRQVRRHFRLVVRSRHRLTESLVDGYDARPGAVHRLLVLEVMLVVSRRRLPHFRAPGLDLDAQDAGALHLRAGRGQPRVPPAALHHAVGDELHGVQLLLRVLDESGVAEEHGGAVVVAVVEGGEGEDQAVDVGGGDADGQAGVGADDVHDAGGDVAVEVQVEGVGEVGAGTGEGAHLADHGEDGWEGGGGRVEGDVDDGRGVDEAVDDLQSIDACSFPR